MTSPGRHCHGGPEWGNTHWTEPGFGLERRFGREISLDDGEHRMADQLRELQNRSRRPAGRDSWLGDDAA
jgi:hypothetical protein